MRILNDETVLLLYCSSGSEWNPTPPKVSPRGAQKDINYAEM